MNPAPVIAVVGDLDPAAAWAQTDADRFVAVDELAAVALADAGVEGDRILVVGAIGERAFAEAGATRIARALRTRFKLAGKIALVEVAGLGAELTGQLALQLSLLDASDDDHVPVRCRQRRRRRRRAAPPGPDARPARQAVRRDRRCRAAVARGRRHRRAAAARGRSRA